MNLLDVRSSVKGLRPIAEKIEVRYPSDKQTADDQIAERALAVAIESRARSRLRALRFERFRELSVVAGKRAGRHHQARRCVSACKIDPLRGVIGVQN